MRIEGWNDVFGVIMNSVMTIICGLNRGNGTVEAEGKVNNILFQQSHYSFIYYIHHHRTCNHFRRTFTRTHFAREFNMQYNLIPSGVRF